MPFIKCNLNPTTWLYVLRAILSLSVYSFPHVREAASQYHLLQLCYSFSISQVHASLLLHCSCSISHHLLCAVASYGGSSSLRPSVRCRNVVGAMVFAKVSPTASCSEVSRVIGSESRKVQREVTDARAKSQDHTVSRQSFRLSKSCARVPKCRLHEV